MTRLAWRNLRHRPGQAALLLLALCLATSTLSVALAVRGAGDNAWERVWHATNGAHVSAFLAYDPDDPPAEAELARARADLVALATAPGVVATSGPWTELVTTGEIGGDTREVEVLVRRSEPAAVGQPLLTAGQWLDGGDGVVLEDGLASTMKVRPGDTVTIAGHRLPVRGVATSVAIGRFPMYQPARIWVSESVGGRVQATGARSFASSIELRLAHQGDAAAFVAARGGAELGPSFYVGLSTWEQRRDASHDDMTAFAVAMLSIGILLAGLTIATAAVLVAGRMASQIRQVGTLKAVGVTPGQVTAVLLAEYLALAGIAAAVGIAAGQALSPALAGDFSRSLYGAPQAPPVTWTRAAAVAGIAIAVVLLATVRPALRGARHSTLRSLTTTARPPRRASRLAQWGSRAGLPLPVVLGLRSALRRPGRAVANAAGLSLGVAMVMIGLALDKGIQDFLAEQAPDTSAVSREITARAIDQLVTLVYAGAGLLIALAAVNAVVVAVFAARDSARNHAILRTVGATPRQTVVAFVVAQLGGCLLACAAGIPLGVLLFTLVGGEDLTPINLPATTYAAVAVVVPLAYAAIVAVPARLLSRRPVTPLLAYE
ncbi:FtsX-like permease family protein [Phytohabitans rumicis]|uniref:FtsX-like permease family protein n=1 Tax=Phytohabitans rumicis TaxID=1076125 RepID=UPI0015670614|nr:FtsX-like permease family protein [Phytohabitans rumicis]